MTTRTWVVRVTMGGDTWYLHQCGSRINNPDTATRFSAAEAENVAHNYRNAYKWAKPEVVTVNTFSESK